eukprot:TRINITY_DN39642_c1_g1_i4.p1 TRINITY_DN39642_c1_g1~~TRINITY_DN39642_c1_g1_i4.p1  ORF type:complete len:400 (-),score=44.28 TRINITY_DN39642_c1_g1_i4:273-1445(-)
MYSPRPGDKPWISEMYGYVFAAANNDIWHKPDRTSMLYPEYQPSEPPRILHYGLYFKIQEYEFDKHWYYNFDPLSCDPVDTKAKKTKGGLFPHPPRPKDLKSYSLKNKPKMGLEYLKDLLGIETIITLNNAFCEHHVAHCPKSSQILEECQVAKEMEKELDQEYRDMEAAPRGSPGSWCIDTHDKCEQWAKQNQCSDNPGYMIMYCKVSCNVCRPLLPPTLMNNTIIKQESQYAKVIQDNKENVSLERKDELKNDFIQSTRQDQRKQILRHRCLNSAMLSTQEVSDCIKAAEEGVPYVRNKQKAPLTKSEEDKIPSHPRQSSQQGGHNLDQMIEQVEQEDALMHVKQNLESNGAIWRFLEGVAIWSLIIGTILFVVAKSSKGKKAISRTL